MKRVVVLLAVVAGFSGWVGAGTFTSVTNGWWHLPSVWDQGGVPQEADDAVVTNTVTLNQDAHVEMLSVPSGVVNAAGHTLRTDSIAEIYGSGTIQGGVFALSTFNLESGGSVGSGTVNANVFNWTGGEIRGGAQVNVVDGTFPSSGVILSLNDSSLRISGTFTQNGTGILRLDTASSVVTNQGAWSLGMDTQPFDGNGFFVNEGTFRKTGGSGTSRIAVPFFDQSGTVRVDSGSIHFDATPQKLFFSNTTFSLASGTYAHLSAGASFEGAITGSGSGTLSLGQDFGTKFYFTNACSLSMGSETINWNVGQFIGDLTTRSPVNLRTTEAHSIYKSRWVAEGGVRHLTTSSLYLDQSVLEIPKNSIYDSQTNGTIVSGNTYSSVQLAGTISKTAGTGTTKITTPVYGDGATLNISSGILSFTGNGILTNSKVFIADQAIWHPGGINSNAVVVGVGSGKVDFYNNEGTAVGLWSLTNADLNVAFYSDLGYVSVAPFLTLEGSNTLFRFTRGQIRDGAITNRIPFEVSAGTAGRTLINCQFYNQAEADFYASGTSLNNSSWFNQTGAIHRIHVDGSFLSGTSSAYHNSGTLRKVAGSGISSSSVRWIDTNGRIEVDAGTLDLAAEYNQFIGTHIVMASGTVFRMSGTLATNLSVEASGPATLQLAANGWDQSGLYDLPLNGPITVELAEKTLSMTGTLSGAEADFEWQGSGGLKNCQITNNLPSRIIGANIHYINQSKLFFFGDTTHSNAPVYLYATLMRNEASATYRLVSDGELMKSTYYGDFHNAGTLLKTGGNGTTQINAIFQNLGGTIGAERGILQFNSAVDFSGGGLQISLGGTNDHGRVKSLGAITADGTLTVALRDGFTPTLGDQFTVLSGTSLTGTFSTRQLPALSTGLEWSLDYTATALTLRVVTSSDSDSDGLGDAWEIRSFGNLTTTSGGTNNVDQDPFTDYQEYIADTLGGDSNDYFRITAISNQTIFFNSSSNRLYTLLGCSNLTSNVWNPVQTSKQGTGGSDSMQSTNGLPNEFYKLKVQLP